MLNCRPRYTNHIHIVDNTTVFQDGKGTMRKHKYKGYFVPLHYIILNV